VIFSWRSKEIFSGLADARQEKTTQLGQKMVGNKDV
jgi:hypothetical protein